LPSASTGLAIYVSGALGWGAYYNGTASNAGPVPITDTWYHVAISRSGTTTKVYVNGVSIISVTDTTNYTGTYLAIGGYVNTSYLMAGYISDFRVVKGTAIYKSNFVPPLAPLTTTAQTTLLLNMDKAGIIDASSKTVFENTGDTKIAFETPYAGSYYSNYFDGTGDTLNLASSAALLGSSSYTVEFWVNLPVAPTGGAYFTAFAYGASGSVLRCFLLDSGGTYLGVWIGAGNVVNVATTAMIGKWAHIAICRNGTSMATYVNGVSVSATTDSTNFNAGQLYIASQSASNFLTGSISNFRIVTGSAVYTANFTPPTAPLTAISGTSLLTCQSKSFVDNSTNAFTITRNGDAIVKSANPFQRNNQSSIYFDGTTDYLLAPTSPNNATSTGNFTVEFWVLPTTFSSYRSMFGNSSSAVNATGWHCGLNASGNVFIYSNSAFKVTTSNAMTLNMWNHVAITRSGSTVTIYINGTSGGTWTLTTETFTDGRFIFGGAPPAGGSEWFAGYLADLRVTKGFARTITVPTSALRTN
jgi:hypothetical protein